MLIYSCCSDSIITEAGGARIASLPAGWGDDGWLVG